MRLLIVEDDALTRKLLGSVFSSVGHHVTSCEDAETALRTVREEHFELIVLDWMLPGMSGLEFCRRLRNEPQGHRYVIVVITARDTTDDMEEVLAAGADDYLTKPLDAQLLGIRLKIAEAQVKMRNEWHEAEQARLEVERKLQKSHELESLAALSGRIAHDLNDLLVGIQCSVDLARREIPQDDGAPAHLARAQQTAKRAAGLSGALLAYSGRGRFVARPVNLSELVLHLEHVLQRIVGDRARLVLDLVHEVQPVKANADQFRHLLLQLVTNAVEALGDGGGVVRIQTGEVEVADHLPVSRESAEWILPEKFTYVEVYDNGCGMDAATKERLFDPFFSTRAPDRGMGMAAVLGIVRGHGGLIRVESEPGKGTTVRVQFPARRKPRGEDVDDTGPVPALESLAPSTGAGSGSLLVVDDERVVLEVIEGALEAAGRSSVTAQDGASAIAALRANPKDFDAAIVDLGMPVMDGLETLAELREIRPDLPVVLSSGYGRHELAGHLRENPRTIFLPKPYLPVDLIHAVRKVLPLAP